MDLVTRWICRIGKGSVGLSLFLVGIFELKAIDITWNSTVGAVNYTSAGAPAEIGDGFIFELGAFEAGFQPTAQNMAQWASHWVALDRDHYNGVSKFFTSRATLSTNTAPFVPGVRAYIWGFNLQTPGEWILITNTQWTWPIAGVGVPAPLRWSVSEAESTTILGQVNGDGFHMMTASVHLDSTPGVHPDAWQQQYFSVAERSDPAISGWHADPDMDGACNLLELAAGTHPRNPSSQPRLSTEVVETGPGVSVIRLRLARSNRASVTHGAEVSTVLGDWSDSGVITVSDTRQELVFEVATSGEGRKFMRMRFGR